MNRVTLEVDLDWSKMRKLNDSLREAAYGLYCVCDEPESDEPVRMPPFNNWYVT